MNGRRWTGQIVDLIHFNVEWKGHVVPQQFETGISQQMQNVVAAAGKEIIYAKNVVTIREKSLTQMTAQKTCSTGNQNTGA
jgi:hypothetical protein